MKAQKFKAPTLEEVQRLFELKRCTTENEPLKFWLHYESNGWYVGKSKMRSWRAAASGWILRMDDYKSILIPKLQPYKPTDTTGKSIEQKLTEQNQIKKAYINQKMEYGNL